VRQYSIAENFRTLEAHNIKYLHFFILLHWEKIIFKFKPDDESG